MQIFLHFFLTENCGTYVILLHTAQKSRVTA